MGDEARGALACGLAGGDHAVSPATPPMRLALLVAAFGLVVLAAYRPAPGSAFAARLAPADSSEWQNLQILPDSISHDRLHAIMDGFKDALGVQCGFCHVRNGREWDYASDAKDHKDLARGMMRMTWQINREILPAIEGLDEHGEPTVTCYTCHRGAVRPLLADTTARSEAHDHAPGTPPHRH